MNVRKLVLGALVVVIVAFALSGLWHTVLMGDFYASAAGDAAREQPLLGSVFLGYVVVAFIMAYLYPKGYEGGSPVAEGLKFGAIIGLLWWFPTQLVLYGAMEGPFSLVLVDGGWHVIEEGVAGIALGWIYGRNE
jgi:hypothetical protein